MRKLTAVAVALMLVTALLAPVTASAATDYSMIRVKLESMGNPASVQFKVAGAYRVAEDPSVDLFPGITYTIRAEGTGIKLTYHNGAAAVAHTLPAKVTFVQYSNGAARNFLHVNNPEYGWRYYSGNMTFIHPSGTSYLQLVNTVYMETYLYGVVAYEMSNDWPAEALKAQAVCARTYAMGRIKTNPGGTWHLVDTSSDQVYRGYPYKDDNVTPMQNVINAVDATAGKALLSGDPGLMSLASGQYSASNGGQIRFTATNDAFDLRNASSPNFTYVFPTTTDPAVMGILSTGDAAKANTMLALLKEKAPQALQEQYGISCAASDVTIHGVAAAQPTALRTGMPVGSREFTKVAVTVLVTVSGAQAPAPAARVRSGGTLITDGDDTPSADDNTDFGSAAVGTPVTKTFTIKNEGNASLTVTAIAASGGDAAPFSVAPPALPLNLAVNATADFTVTYTPAAEGQSQSSIRIDSNDAGTPYTFAIRGSGAAQGAQAPAAPADTQGTGAPAQAGGGGMPVPFAVVVTLDYVSQAGDGDWDVYGQMRTRFSPYSSLLGTRNLWLLYDWASGDGNFLYVTARGYGHGKGMSQRGAQQMAREGRSHADILAFYYPAYAIAPTDIAPKTLGPIPGQGASAQWGKVTASSLNVRAATSTNGVKLAVLPRNAVVEIIGTYGAWYKILQASTGLVGYASSQYLVKTVSGPTATPQPTQSPTATGTASPTATASPGAPTPTATPAPVMGRIVSTTLNLRSQPNTTSSILYTLKRGDSVFILDANAAPNWYKVRYLNYTGYCMYLAGTTTYIELIGASTGPTPTGTGAPGVLTVVPVTAKANVSSGYLTLRASASTTAAKVKEIPKGASFTVVGVHTTNTWLKASYRINGATYSGYVLAQYALVGGVSGYKACTVAVAEVNVRAGAGTNSAIIGTLKSGNTVIATSTVTLPNNEVWVKILCGSTVGYVSKPLVRVSSP